MTSLSVYQAITAITKSMAKEGISKDRKNQQQGYSFRGIDDVYQSLAPKLAENNLCILPRVISKDCIERVNAKGTPLFFTTLVVEFDLVSAIDGSKHTICTVGEAMDSGDKSCNKAMSAAYKYAAFQAFAIPTEGDNDADAHTHEVASKAPAKPVAAFDVAKACNAIRTAETRAKAEHYADVAFERATNDQQRKAISDALQSYEVAA